MRLGARVILCLAFLAGVSAVGATDPEPGRLTFIKSFRGSLPEYMRVTITRSGEAVYQGGFIEQPSEPETFHLSEATTERLFRLAAALNYFRGLELEYGRRVARLGDKTFRYEEAGERLEVRYNYTENATAQELQQWFERIGRGRYLNQQLEYTLAFDRLGVPAAMRDFERAFNAGELVDPEQFVPVLERVAEDTRVMRLARNRARDLLRRIRSPQSRLTIEHEDRRAGSYTKLVLDEQGRSSYEIRGLHQSSQAQPLNVPPAIHRRLLELVRVANYLGGYVSSGVGPEAAAGYRLTYEAGPRTTKWRLRNRPTRC